MLSTLEKLFQKKSTSNYGWGLNHCFDCSQRTRQGMLFPEDQVAFCERCFHSTTCWCCHLPCGPLHRRLSDERKVCQHCYNTALLSPRQLGPLYEGTIQFFEKKMKMRLKTRPRLKVTISDFCLNNSGFQITLLGFIPTQETKKRYTSSRESQKTEHGLRLLMN